MKITAIFAIALSILAPENVEASGARPRFTLAAREVTFLTSDGQPLAGVFAARKIHTVRDAYSFGHQVDMLVVSEFEDEAMSNAAGLAILPDAQVHIRNAQHLASIRLTIEVHSLVADVRRACEGAPFTGYGREHYDRYIQSIYEHPGTDKPYDSCELKHEINYKFKLFIADLDPFAGVPATYICNLPQTLAEYDARKSRAIALCDKMLGRTH